MQDLTYEQARDELVAVVARLEAGGIPAMRATAQRDELADGTLKTLPPVEAARHVDKLWDLCLDQLPDIATSGEGREIERQPPQP